MIGPFLGSGNPTMNENLPHLLYKAVTFSWVQVGNMSNKKEEAPQKPEPKTLDKYCRPLAFVSLILAVGLLLFVLFSPASPKNVIQGGAKKWKVTRGGCGCDAPGYGGKWR